MKRGAVFGALSAAAALAAVAWTGQASADTGPIPAFHAIAEGTIAPIAAPAAPKHVAREEQHEDLELKYVVLPTVQAQPARTTIVQRFRPNARPRMPEPAPPAPRVDFLATSESRCLTAFDGRVGPYQTWVDHPVFTERSERVIGKGDDAKLEIADLFIDPSTLGAKVFARQEIRLTPIARGPHGYVLYAFRHDSTLELVSVDDGVQMAGGVSMNSACAGLTRMTLDGAAGQMATLTGTLTSAVEPTWSVVWPNGAPPEPRLWTLKGMVSVSRTASDPEPLLAITLSTSQIAPAVADEVDPSTNVPAAPPPQARIRHGRLPMIRD